MVKKAFTLIELIFAIVIIGIAVVSLPMMTRITSQGIEDNIIQEAIFAASAELMSASSGYWDANSMEDANVSNIARVLNDGGGCNNDKNSSRFRLRAGHIAQPLHRRCVDSNSTTASNANGTVFFSLENAAHPESDIFINTTTEASGYKETYRSIVTVTQAGDIKLLDINITGRDKDGDGTRDAITNLRLQSANIGEIDYFKRRF